MISAAIWALVDCMLIERIPVPAVFGTICRLPANMPATLLVGCQVTTYILYLPLHWDFWQTGIRHSHFEIDCPKGITDRIIIDPELVVIQKFYFQGKADG